MSSEDDLATLVCLFHNQSNADAALEDLVNAGISRSAITLVGGPNAGPDALEKSELASLGMPDRDYDHLRQASATAASWSLLLTAPKRQR